MKYVGVYVLGVIVGVFLGAALAQWYTGSVDPSVEVVEVLVLEEVIVEVPVEVVREVVVTRYVDVPVEVVREVEVEVIHEVWPKVDFTAPEISVESIILYMDEGISAHQWFVDHPDQATGLRGLVPWHQMWIERYRAMKRAFYELVLAQQG